MNIKWRLEPEQVPGKGWRVVVATGNRKKKNRVAHPVCNPVYTLAQAQTFCANNRASDFATRPDAD